MRKTTWFIYLLVATIIMVSCKKEEEEKETLITSFFITSPVSAVGIIDEASQTITVNVPYGTDLTNMIGTISFSSGATVTPDITTGVDFSSLSVNFTVTNGPSTATYAVVIVVGPNPLRIVLVGDAATVDDLDNEVKTAYNWALDEYDNAAKYVSFSDLPSEDLTTATVIWWHYTVWPKPDPWALPENATGSALTTITDFYKGGGNLLLTSLASSYLVDLGRIVDTLGPTNLDIPGDEYITNPDNWGISFQDVLEEDDFPANNETHFLFDGLTTSDVTFEGHTYPAIFMSDGGAKKNRAHLWDFNRFHHELPGGADDPNARKTAWETDANALVRATFEWDPSLNGVELGVIVEFEPSGDYTGTAFVITLGAYEWYMEDERTNAWMDNVKGITLNALDNLME